MAATLLDGCQSENLKMGDSSLDTLESSLDTSTSQTEAASDDEDDELLALRIAALESIKLKESKLASSKVKATQQPKKPDFVIKSHPKRSNLLSIVTCEEEYETSLPNKQSQQSPPTVTPFFDPTRPPPGFARNSPPPRRYSRSPPSRRYSRSPPRRWSRSPLPARRRSISPFRRRRSFSRSPIRRSKSPLHKRSRSPFLPRRSPTPRRSPSPSEWETDTESEEENDEDVKKEAEVKVEQPAKKPVVVKKPLNDDDDPDASVDDVLKLDATDEVDEFSAFLNEFEDEVLTEKEEAKETPVKKAKKERPLAEKKVLDGKRLRKKVKPKKSTPPPASYTSRSPGRRRSPSPRWRMGPKTGVRSPGGRVRSPGRRFFSPGRGRDGKLSPRRRNRTPSLSPESRIKRAQLKGSPVKRSSKSPERRSAKSKDRSSKSKDKTVKESKPVETSAEREERERKQYDERIKKLPTPDREILEARRKKFEKKVDISSAEPKKISLKSDKPEAQTMRVDRFGSKSEEDELNADIGDTLDMFDEKQKPSKLSVTEKDPPARKNVTDLRVQLHKKRQALGGAKPDKTANRALGGKHPLLRSVSPSSGPNSDGLDEDDFGPVSHSGRRKVVPPGKVPVKARLKISVNNRSEEESDRSPSPPPKKMSKKRRRSGDSLESTGDITGIGGRRILVVRKDVSRENSPDDISITTVTSPRKGIKKSLHLRLGEKIDQAQFSENEIYAEMLRQQEEKKHAKKLKKEVKELKKREKLEKKGKKKSKKVKKLSVSNDDFSDEDLNDSGMRKTPPGADSDEELFRFFEDQEQENSSEERKNKKKINSGKGDQVRARRSSGEKFVKRRSSASGDGERVQRGREDVGRIKARLGKKVGLNGDGERSLGKGGRRESDEMLFDLEKFQGSTDEESLDILEKMKRKNEKRLKRMREIEQDKLMFA